MRLRRLTLPFITLLLTVSLVAAQNADCVAGVQAIIEAAQAACPNVGINEVCYGSAPLTVQPRPNVRLNFSEPGDIATLAAVESLIGSPFDAEAGEGAVAIMNIRANLLEGAVRLVAFGDFEIQNLSHMSADFIALPVRSRYTTGTNVRSLPSPESEVVGALRAGEFYAAVGRTEDAAWVMLQTGGWAAVDALLSDHDLTALAVVESDTSFEDADLDGTLYGTMGAVQLRTGLDDAPCAGAPDSGLLVQSPDGQNTPLIRVNGLPVEFSGTVLFQTTPERKTVLTVLEGEARSAAFNKLSGGQQLVYGYQGEIIQAAAPTTYNYARARYLPLALLPREIELPFSLGGLIYPFVPGTGFLNTIPADGTCTVAWAGDVNVRSGPGTNYPIRQGVPGGYYAEPDARAVGTDGRVWWRLAEAIWLSADTTVGAGACGTLPLVDPPPLESG
jgi:uncharacterized protein YraI